MFFTKHNKKNEVERLIDEHLEVMLVEAETKEDISEVLLLMERYRELKKKKHFSPDTLLVVAGNLLGIVLILNYEKLNVVTTKALTFVIRGRV
jgi:hypothetical protein